MKKEEAAGGKSRPVLKLIALIVIIAAVFLAVRYAVIEQLRKQTGYAVTQELMNSSYSALSADDIDTVRQKASALEADLTTREKQEVRAIIAGDVTPSAVIDMLPYLKKDEQYGLKYYAQDKLPKKDFNKLVSIYKKHI